MTAGTLRVAVVGSGPSGFYATEALFQNVEDVCVDMYERLPTPFGLVRSGVAPDRPKLKEVTAVYSRLMQDSRFASLELLGRIWPAFTARRSSLAGTTAIRITGTSRSTSRMRPRSSWDRATSPPDVAAHALEALRGSRVRTVHLVGRRGPVQSKFTTKELRGLTSIRDCAVEIEPTSLTVSCRLELADRRNVNAAKNFELFEAGVAQSDAARRLAFRFLLEPEAVVGDGRVERIIFRRTRLEGPAFAQSACATEERVDVDCGLVLTSIGYRGRPIDGVPFDEARGVVPKVGGLVETESEDAPWLYVTGWLKRGPTGIIGTNRADSIETIQRLLAALPAFPRKPSDARNILLSALADHIVVDVEGWTKIDAAERANGMLVGKPREKYVRVDEMLDCLDLGDVTGTRKAFGTGTATEHPRIGM